MTKHLKFGNVVLSEHGVKGENNKHTLINTYCGDLLVANMPVQLFFCIYVEVLDVVEDVDITLKVRLDNIEFAKITAKMTKGVLPSASGVIFIESFQAGFARDTTMSIVASAQDYSTKTILKRRISVGIAPTPVSISSPLRP